MSESALNTASGWAPKRVSRGSDGDLTENAASLRFASYGILPLGKTGSWRRR
ncbi:hypothetical protein LNP20_07345 [Klebsiella pneumoniae subsp. pneumoniae]|nr:hypothetical protein [Klebsiella pneumoniae subsp. pneumoniae]